MGNEARQQRRPAFGLTWADAPRLGPFDLLGLLWIERKTAVSVAAAICVVGALIALLAPKTYTARAELLVRLGPEYVYQANDSSGGVAPDMPTVLNAELRMLGSGAVVRGAIERVGMTRLYPGIHGAGPVELAAAERAFTKNLALETAPQTPSIALSFKHSNPQVAARAVNSLIDSYLARRREVLFGGEYAALARQGVEIDQRTRAANTELDAFLAANQIGDFEAELTAAAQRLNDIDAQLLDATAKRGEAEARRVALRARYRTEPAQIELFSESDARRALVQAQLEREQLLSRYQADALPVREVDRRIAQLQLFLSGGDPASVTRRGPNPIRQEIDAQLVTAEADSHAQAGRQDTLRTQREAVAARLRQLQTLQPEFSRLMRARTVLEQSATAFAHRAEEARALGQQSGSDAEAISEVERALPPTQGQSLRMPIAVITLLLALVLGVAAGLARGLMRQSFPTPTSAARTLNAPVLAVVAGGATPKPKRKPRLRVVASRS